MKKIVLMVLIIFPSKSLPAYSPPSQPSSNPYLETVTHACIYAGVAGLIVLLGKGISALAQTVSSPIIQKEPLTWAGPLPRAFERILDLQRHPEIFKKFEMESPHGFLLYGPPGTGKTMLAHVLSQKLNIPLLKESSGNFISIYQGSGTSYLSMLLKKAHSVPSCGKPFKCVVFIDEIDGITSRKESPNREELRIAEHLLTAISAPENRDLLFVGATNIFETIDKALVRPGRLTPVYVGLPSPANRKALFEHFLKKHHFPPPNISPILLAESTDGFSCADIKSIIEEAIYRHIKHPTYLPDLCLQHCIDTHKRNLCNHERNKKL